MTIIDNCGKRSISRLCLTPMMLLLISAILYLMPFAVGEGEIIEDGKRYMLHYHTEAIYVAVFVIVCIIAAIVLFRPRELHIRINRDSDAEAIVLFLSLVPLTIYTAATPAMYSLSKLDVIDATDRLHSTFMMLCSITIIFIFITNIRRYIYLAVICIAGIAFIMYIGHRSVLAIGILGCGYIYMRNTPITKTNPLYVIAGTLFLVFLMLYKAVYIAIKEQNYGLVLEKLQASNIFDSALVGAEPITTSRILDYVVIYNYSPPCTNFLYIPLSILPFMEKIIEPERCSFNAQMQPVLFWSYEGGVAANIWAEFYSVFGWAGIPILVILLWLVSNALEAVIRRVRSPVMVAGLVVAVIQFTFYIQRNELLIAVTLAKRALLICLFAMVISKFIPITATQQHAPAKVKLRAQRSS